MLKHASITRPSKRPSPAPVQRPASPEWEQLRDCGAQTRTPSPQQPAERHPPEQPHQHLLMAAVGPLSPAGSSASYHSYSSSRLPAAFMSSLKRNCVGSLPSTPLKPKPARRPAATQPAPAAPVSGESMIKVFAQKLGQEVEYVTLQVHAQTKSQQIIKSLLRKFRLKHRDPNLFYLTLERYIRKDGLKCKNTMLLGDEACPMQYQQCCSNPPYNDIKFTLQTRAGVLVKIYCSDVVPESRYKCLSLSTQTTVEETIELTLHCLNLIPTSSGAEKQQSSPETLPTATARQASSPSSTGSTNSSNSSSSGIDSDLPISHNKQQHFISQRDNLDSSSRASSTTSISSTSNLSSISTSTIIDQYCLIIECKDSNYKRILETDEYLVDVYQSLLTEAREQAELEERRLALSAEFRPQAPAADQWFFIKLKRRHDISQHPNAISFASARQAMPLPPIPASISNQPIGNELKQIVSTTQIEVSRRRPSSSLAGARSAAELCRPLLLSNPSPEMRPDVTDSGNCATIGQQPAQQVRQRCPPPPALIILPPMVRPRRRNLSNASSTFLPQGTTRTASFSSRRRYDPAQLEADLSRLELSCRREVTSGEPLAPERVAGCRLSVVVDRNNSSNPSCQSLATGGEATKPETSPN